MYRRFYFLIFYGRLNLRNFENKIGAGETLRLNKLSSQSEAAENTG